MGSGVLNPLPTNEYHILIPKSRTLIKSLAHIHFAFQYASKYFGSFRLTQKLARYFLEHKSTPVSDLVGHLDSDGETVFQNLFTCVCIIFMLGKCLSISLWT